MSLSLNQRVPGSSPGAPTTQPIEIINDFDGFCFCLDTLQRDWSVNGVYFLEVHTHQDIGREEGSPRSPEPAQTLPSTAHRHGMGSLSVVIFAWLSVRPIQVPPISA